MFCFFFNFKYTFDKKKNRAGNRVPYRVWTHIHTRPYYPIGYGLHIHTRPCNPIGFDPIGFLTGRAGREPDYTLPVYIPTLACFVIFQIMRDNLPSPLKSQMIFREYLCGLTDAAMIENTKIISSQLLR